jgi:hypothetical protein
MSETTAQRKARLLAELADVAEIERLEAELARKRAKLNLAPDDSVGAPIPARPKPATEAVEIQPSNEPTPAPVFDGTLGSLVRAYQTDPDSPHHKKRFHVRKNHDFTLKRIANAHGAEALRDINARLLISWHKQWSDGGKKLAMGHAFVGHLRVLFGFGATILDDRESERLSNVMAKMRFEAGKSRVERLTSSQVDIIRAKAREMEWPSIALAQAFQFETLLRQKDVIGEWIPLTEPGEPVVENDGRKWLRGLQWSEIDDDLILRHPPAMKTEVPKEVDLKQCRMILEELQLAYDLNWSQGIDRSELPATGPIIICEHTKLPFHGGEFRRKWRIIADAVEIPKNVRNMDSRTSSANEERPLGVRSSVPSDASEEALEFGREERLVH